MRAPMMALMAVLIGTAANAEPPRAATAERPKPAQSANDRREIVLASAEAVHVPAADTSAAPQAPKRRVAPRVTTCRSGDQQVDPETQDQ